MSNHTKKMHKEKMHSDKLEGEKEEIVNFRIHEDCSRCSLPTGKGILERKLFPSVKIGFQRSKTSLHHLQSLKSEIVHLKNRKVS